MEELFVEKLSIRELSSQVFFAASVGKWNILVTVPLVITAELGETINVVLSVLLVVASELGPGENIIVVVRICVGL
jgi:hypothetical protein